MQNEINPRKPLLAALMSSVLPGFGQIYNGEINKAIWLFLIFAFLTVPGMALVALYLPDVLMMPALLLSLVMTIAAWAYGIVDAWRTAKRLNAYVAQPWQLSGTYMLILILCNLIGFPLVIGYVRAHQVEPLRVPSASMEPSVMTGDYFFADKRYNCLGCKQGVSRGDIALFANPNNRTMLYIKRIIGLPGDRVQINGTGLSVNGVLLTTQTSRLNGKILTTESEGNKHWQVQWSETVHTPIPSADMIVPPGQVFVLGDNRNMSTDSRVFGTVSLQDVVGKARQVWFSAGKEGVRWSRMGKVLE
jgi:signal peptidase I